MKKVYTVLGPIHPDELGLTAMHEHIFWGPPGWEYDPHWWFSKTAAYEKAHKDLSRVPQTLVELPTSNA